VVAIFIELAVTNMIIIVKASNKTGSLNLPKGIIKMWRVVFNNTKGRNKFRNDISILNRTIARVSIVLITVIIMLNNKTMCIQINTAQLDENSESMKGSIVGGVFVKSDNDRPVYNATVHLYDPKIRKVQLSVNTNSYGEFSFDEVILGDYIVVISYSGYYDHPVSVSVKEGITKIEKQYIKRPDFGSDFPVTPGQPNAADIKLKDAFNKYQRISGYPVLTVCECLKVEPLQLLQSLQGGVIIIGTLMQTPEGNWMEQSCGNPVTYGDHNWSDAIFLNKDINRVNVTEHKKLIDNFDFMLNEAINFAEKNYIQNNDIDHNIAVAVIGQLITSDNLVYVECGENDTCGFGYGPIAAPLQMNYYHMRHFNQQDADTD